MGYLDILTHYSQFRACSRAFIVIFYGLFHTLFNQNINKLVKRFTMFLLDHGAWVLGHEGRGGGAILYVCWSVYLLAPWLR